MFENISVYVGYLTVLGERGRFCHNLKEIIYINRDVTFFSKMGLLLTSVKTILSGSCNTLTDYIQTP